MKDNNFIIGCNYWASNAGAEMWNNWDVDIVKNDIKVLSQNGIKYLRVFPNWCHFQPVQSVLSSGGNLIEYRLVNDVIPDNPYYLDRKMLDRFKCFCSICDKYNVKIIVSLLTGWMSGRLFIPPVLHEKNLICDTVAIYFEQLFLQGFVSELKNENSIMAWDIGNECNCMYPALTYEHAAVWTKTMADAIKTTDSTRPIISGVHTLTPSRAESSWTISCQADNCDILVTHPYPFWSTYAKYDDVIDISILLYPTAVNKFYSQIGKKPCLTAEIGTMGPSVVSDEISQKFMTAQLYSAWENNSKGVLWWCAHDQNKLDTLPYTWNMCETELGLFDNCKKPKPVVKAIENFNAFLDTIDFELPQMYSDALCISTYGQEQLGISYASFMLSKLAGFDIDFEFCTGKFINDNNVYMLPSYSGINVMPKEKYIELLNKVSDGASLYISYCGGIISNFKHVTGLEIISSKQGAFSDKTCINGKTISYTQNSKLKLKPIDAQILAYDANGEPVISKNKYGKGYIYFVSFSPEQNLLYKNNVFSNNMFEIYRLIFDEVIRKRPVQCKGKNLFITNHYQNQNLYCVITNYSKEYAPLNLDIGPNYTISRTYNTKSNCIEPYHSAVAALKNHIDIC